MSIELLVQSLPDQPGLLRQAGDLDRFASELGAALGQHVQVREAPLQQLVPAGPALLLCTDVGPLVQLLGKAAFARTLLLDTRPGDCDELLSVAAPAGLVDARAFALWRKGAALDRLHSGLILRQDWFNESRHGTPLADSSYAVARPQGEQLPAYLAAYLQWLAAGT